jgi:integrase
MTFKLTALSVDRLRAPGRYPDGGGLYLQVTGKSAKSWLFRYGVNGKEHWMGLGSAQNVSLKQARQLRDTARGKIAAGDDPVEKRHAERAAVRAARNAIAVPTFRKAVDRYFNDHCDDWSSPKYRRQWLSTLLAYAGPIIGDLPVTEITASHVVEVLRPIWKDKPTAARYVRGRIEVVLDYAADPDDQNFRNPATLTERLKKALPKARREVEHHPALPYAEMTAFMVELRSRDGAAARALEFVILTAARTVEALGATWPEIDLRAKLWTVPANRMKARKEHRVPLSDAAIAVLDQMSAVQENDFIFPGMKTGRPLSNMALLKVLERMGRTDLTTHGFRSTFRDWAGDRAKLEGAREAAEAALAHVLKDKTEAAYRRSDLFEKRRVLMAMWAQYCDTPADDGDTVVVPLKRPNIQP